MSRRGFLLGKFLPPHNGHLLLCDFARNFCDELTILVCSLPGDPIPGSLRHEWMRELLPSCRVLHFDRVVPQEPREHPAFWDIWRAIVRAAHPEPIDFVFASEPYGHRLAAELDAAFVPADPGRLAVPVSGSRIREQPFAFWQYLPRPVRAHFTKTVCLFGPESSGKTTLATMLGRALQTVVVPEYGRIHTEAFGTTVTSGDLLRIVRGHAALTSAARRLANRILVCDTDPVLTAVWSDMLLGERSGQLDSPAIRSDLYLLTDVDMPWEDDGTRYFATQDKRREFFVRCRDELDRRGLPYRLVSGDPTERLHAARAAIEEAFPDVRTVGRPEPAAIPADPAGVTAALPDRPQAG
jgi:NadR type nicotinamide-nucleotide adenylyltransferase